MVKHVVRDEDLWYGHIRECVSSAFARVGGKVRNAHAFYCALLGMIAS